ncbi:hypothetical protein ABK046_49905, partial [Streptomyces caeruleatus]
SNGTSGTSGNSLAVNGTLGYYAKFGTTGITQSLIYETGTTVNIGGITTSSASLALGRTTSGVTSFNIGGYQTAATSQDAVIT